MEVRPQCVDRKSRQPQGNYPSRTLFCPAVAEKEKYDIYLTVELTHNILKYERRSKPIIHWIQDPRPWSEWLEIQTVKLFPENSYWSSSLYDSVNKLYGKGLVTFVSQGYFLNDKAIELYRLPGDAPIAYMPTPSTSTTDSIRRATPKEPYPLHRTHRIHQAGLAFLRNREATSAIRILHAGSDFPGKSQNESIMAGYRDIPNLHFVGHVEGEEKMKYIREAKILVNTSIHEALPITFLEALAYGTLLVSCRNPEDLTSKFGRYTGPVLGDGFDKVPLFTSAIEELIENEGLRKELSCKAVEYIREIHPVHKFKST
ncbi:MAG: glycosyltransferase [Alistipes sp.]